MRDLKLVKITKAMVQGGATYTEDFPVPELGGSLTIRPLDSREHARFQQILMKNVKITGEKSIQKLTKGIADLKDLSLGDFLFNQKEASLYGLSKAIVDDEPWTTDDVAKLPAKVIDRAIDRVLEITGDIPGMEAAVKKFRRK